MKAIINIGLKKGVLDSQGKATHHTLDRLGFSDIVKDVRVDFNNFERAQLFIIIEKGKNEGYINIKNINSIVDIAMMIMTSIEIPLFLQDKYDEYKSSMNELVFIITNSLRSLK